MAAPTVYSHMAGDFDIGGRLFAGKKFFVVQRVPSRHRLLDDIKANGGEIVMFEKNADYVIADHLLPKFCPPGSISYEFVDKSIQDGVLRDPEHHPAGPLLGEAREPGAINRPTKFGRNAFTADEDRILCKWVRDREAAGGLSSGNEIYKLLEAAHPSHTWQSWRDRYIRKLKNRPPSAFNIPDNAPPSPPSDRSNQRAPPEASSSKPAEQPAHDPELRPPKRRIIGTGKAGPNDDYSLEALAGMFDSEDWEELYAFVDIIESTTGERRSKAWAEWASFQDKQTAEQWAQYYEKVVRPQWERDPEWKRQKIKQKVERKHEHPSSQSQAASQQQKEPDKIGKTATVAQEQPTPAVGQPSATAGRAATEWKQGVRKPVHKEAGKFDQLLGTTQNHSTAAAYVYYARKMKSSALTAHPSLDRAGLHKLLIGQWHSLSDEEKAPYVAMDEAAKSHREHEVAKLAKLSSEVKLMSSSTARHESPVVLKEMYETAMKRARSHGAFEEHVNQQEQSIRPRKRRRSEGATPLADDVAQKAAPIGTHAQPLEVSSQTSETSVSRATEDRLEEQFISDMAQNEPTGPTLKVEEQYEPDNATESIESDEPLTMDDKTLLPDDTEEDSPLNSPTPRAPRHQKNVFDTQVILSSPTHDIFTREPQPKSTIRKLKAEGDPQSSSPLVQSRSDASTPPSIQEFRRSLNDEDLARLSYPQPSLLSSHSHSRQSPSPAPSSTSSTDSGDPDPPLTASEFETFFQEQYDEGFGDDYIVAALKRTRMRPGLAIQVLEAWAQGQPLPDARGIWTAQDDEEVERGGGVALDRLARKHSLDGWGGVTERMVFLEGYRSR